MREAFKAGIAAGSHSTPPATNPTNLSAPAHHRLLKRVPLGCVT